MGMIKHCGPPTLRPEKAFLNAIGLSLALASGLSATPVFISGTTASFSSMSFTTVFTVSNTVPDEVLVVGLTSEDHNITTGITYAGVGLTNIYTIPFETSSVYNVEGWYLLAPAQGTADLVVNRSAATSGQVLVGLALYGGAQQGSNLTNFSQGSPGAVDWITTDLNTASPNSLILSFFGYGVGYAVTAAPVGFVQRETTNYSGYHENILDAPAPTPGNYAAAWTFSGTAMPGQILAELVEAQASPTCSFTPTPTLVIPTATPTSTATQTPTATPSGFATMAPTANPSASPQISNNAGGSFAFIGVYPNPIPSSGTIFAVRIPTGGQVTIEIYTLKGEKVAAITSSFSNAGIYEIPWNVRNGSGIAVSFGSYFSSMTFSGQGAVSKAGRWISVTR
jgi:hypothetical protein